MKGRKLGKMYRFRIVFDEFVSFKDLNGDPLKFKLTPGQWKRAKKYVDRKLIPFYGYEYTAKDKLFRGTIAII